MSLGRRLLVGFSLLSLALLGAGCQQELTCLSGWVTEGDKSSIRILEAPEVELASAPVRGAAVTVHKRERGKDRVVGHARTDRTGRFSVTVLREPGGLARWQLTVEKPGYQPAQAEWGRLPRRSQIYWRVELTPTP